MKPRPFDYARPDTVDEAVALLAEHGDEARVLAGGQSLMAMINLRLADPAVLIDIARIAELDAIRDLGDKIEVGAAVTQNTLLAWPELAEEAAAARRRAALRRPFPDPQQGHGLRLDRPCRPELRISAVARAAGRRGGAAISQARRRACSPPHDFQHDMLTTARAPDELITAVRFPVDGKRGVAFREVARRHGDFAIVAVAAVVEAARQHAARRRRHDRHAGRAPHRDRWLRDAVERLAWELEGYDDIHASARMRRDLLRRSARSSSRRRSDAPREQERAHADRR